MGRGKGKAVLKLIAKEKARRSTFGQRKKGLKEKFSKLNSICTGNEACMIVYDGDDNDNGKPSVWPDDPSSSRVEAILEKYERVRGDADNVEKYDSEDYFNFRIMEVEAKIAKVKKDIFKIQYPTSDPRIDQLSEEQLGLLIAQLNAKSETCNQKTNERRPNDQPPAPACGTRMKKKNKSQESGESSNPSKLNFVMNTPQWKPCPSRKKPINDTNGIVDQILTPAFGTSMNECRPNDQPPTPACGTRMKKKNKSQESGESSNPSKLNFVMNTPQWKPCPSRKKPINDTNGIVDQILTPTFGISMKKNTSQESGESSNPSELNSVMSTSQGQPISTHMKPLDDNNGMADQAPALAFGTSINIIQEIDESSNPSQFNSMMKTSHGQPGLAPMKPLDDSNGMADQAPALAFGSSINIFQEIGESSNPSQFNYKMNPSHEQPVLGPTKPLDDNNGMANQGPALAFGTSINIFQEIGESSNPSQFNSMMNTSHGQPVLAPMKPIDDNNEMVDSTVQVGVSIDPTSQLLGDLNWADLGDLDSTSYQYDSDFLDNLLNCEDDITLPYDQF